MQPIFFTVGAKLRLMVIPDSQAHADGHPVLTYTYSIYRDKTPASQEQIDSRVSELLLEKKHDPDYMGTITFELPGRLFNYEAGEGQELTSDEVEEAIEQITHYRETPGMWQL
ncbi:MAG: hypothetical protein ACRYFB_08670 [Janthinobacterium lividum]